MIPVECRWCGRLATGTVTARGNGLAVTIPHCDQCWDRTYQEVRHMPHRSWRTLGRRPRKKTPVQPDALF